MILKRVGVKPKENYDKIDKFWPYFEHKNNFNTRKNSLRRLEVIGQKLLKLSILAKKLKFATNGKILSISKFSQYIEYVFLKEEC